MSEWGCPLAVTAARRERISVRTLAKPVSVRLKLKYYCIARPTYHQMKTFSVNENCRHALQRWTKRRKESKQNTTPSTLTCSESRCKAARRGTRPVCAWRSTARWTPTTPPTWRRRRWSESRWRTKSATRTYWSSVNNANVSFAHNSLFVILVFSYQHDALWTPLNVVESGRHRERSQKK